MGMPFLQRKVVAPERRAQAPMGCSCYQKLGRSLCSLSHKTRAHASSRPAVIRPCARALLTMPLVFQMKKPSGSSPRVVEQQSWLEGWQSAVQCLSYSLLFLPLCWGPSLAPHASMRAGWEALSPALPAPSAQARIPAPKALLSDPGVSACMKQGFSIEWPTLKRLLSF